MQEKKEKLIKILLIILFAFLIVLAIVLSCVLIHYNKQLESLEDDNAQIEEQLENLE